jgi:hypothetical protein
MLDISKEEMKNRMDICYITANYLRDSRLLQIHIGLFSLDLHQYWFHILMMLHPTSQPQQQALHDETLTLPHIEIQYYSLDLHFEK